MLGPAITPHSSNPFVSQLEPLLQVKTPPGWLVIAHSDHQMIQRISRALDEQALLLAVPQSSWDWKDGHLAEAITWALDTHSIDRLMLVGHSQGVLHPTEARLVGGTAPREVVRDLSRESNYDRLLAGVHQTQTQLQHAEQAFADQFTRLSQLAGVHARAKAGSLQMQGLFYLADSGVFLVLDADRQVYYSLSDTSACA